MLNDVEKSIYILIIIIFKSYIIEQNLNNITNNILLFYGENLGLKDDLRSKIKNLNKKALIKNLDQEEILANENNFFNEIHIT